MAEKKAAPRHTVHVLKAYTAEPVTTHKGLESSRAVAVAEDWAMKGYMVHVYPPLPAWARRWNSNSTR